MCKIEEALTKWEIETLLLLALGKFTPSGPSEAYEVEVLRARLARALPFAS